MKTLILTLAIGLFGTVGLAAADSNSASPKETEKYHMKMSESGDMEDMMQMMSKMAPMMRRCEEMMASMKNHMKSSDNS